MQVMMNLAAQPSRRERRSAELRERVFRSALNLFAHKGFAETTVEDITNAADVGKGTFFNYFPSKDHLLAAFGQMQISKLEAAAESAGRSTEPMTVFLHNLAMRMTEEPVRNPSVVRAVLLANLSSEPVRQAMRENHRRAERFLTRIIEVGQTRGEIRGDLPAREIALGVRQALIGTLLVWTLFGDDSLSARIEACLRVLWNGLTPGAPADKLLWKTPRPQKVRAKR
jgi:AcrR family transcriptional regulator